MISAVAQGLIPEHYFRTLCQNEGCRVSLGGFHIPHVGGTVMYACHRCRNVSIFRSEQFGIQSYLLDVKGTQLDKKTLKPLNSAAPSPSISVPVKPRRKE